MIERPMLMNGPMVRATLDGSKTHTRRIFKLPPGTKWGSDYDGQVEWLKTCPGQSFPSDCSVDELTCPYGSVGDQLWVRETWRTDDSLNDKAPSMFSSWPVKYEADGKRLAHGAFQGNTNGKTRVSIHMPRWASRIQLEITSVRVERLNGISEADAKAEGTTPSCVGSDLEHLKYRAGFQTLWESINGSGSWNVNPWVWVIEFKQVKS